MYIVLLTYKVPLEVVDSFLPEHVIYLNDRYAEGAFLMSGRKVPRNGGVILANATARKDLDELLKMDPLHINGIADYEVIEFEPGMAANALAFLLPKDA